VQPIFSDFRHILHRITYLRLPLAAKNGGELHRNRHDKNILPSSNKYSNWIGSTSA